MSDVKKYRKDDFIRMLVSSADAISNDSESVEKYAKKEGIELDKVRDEGKKRVKRMMLKLNAEKTKNEMLLTSKLKQRAIEMVEELMAQVNFSFQNYVQTENIVVHSRNIEQLTAEDIKETLVEYHYLKLIESEKDEAE